MGRLRRFLLGPPKDPKDPEAFHKLSLVAVLAWVGLGADGLSSSAYGPDEAYKQLGEHTGLAFFLAVLMAATVFIISYGYSRIIEQFPSGGGGYVVASKLLGPKVGVVSGAALLVDYVLTITISIASGGDAIFSFLPHAWLPWKLPFVFAGLAVLTIMNARGVKESVTTLVPIFGVFLVTHAVLLVATFGGHLGNVVETADEVRASVGKTTAALGAFATLKLFVRAYSLGGGTYTGIEAVSNGVGMMREPRVQTAKRTMVLMATSLAITAAGILLSYLLVHAHPEEGKTMNAVLLERVANGWELGGVPFGKAFVIVALFSEGALLFVAAQAGFMDGPRVMANMAVDSWLPRRFAALSDRLSMRNGVMIMAVAAMASLVYTGGDVSKLVVMYAINVFLTFSLSNLAMALFWIRRRREEPTWLRHLPAHVLALLLCVTILVITIVEKFAEGGWVTLVATAALVVVCFLIRRHYARVVAALRQLDVDLPSPPEVEAGARAPAGAAAAAATGKAGAGAVARAPRPSLASVGGGPVSLADFAAGPTAGLVEHHGAMDPDPAKPVAILFVGGYSGLGRHALLTLLRMFPEHFEGIVFVSVAVIDSESFKGPDQVEALEARTRESLVRYERYARTLGVRAASAFAIGTEVQVEAERVASGLAARYPKALFVAGQLIFEEDTLWNRILHNETAFLVQQRLQRMGVPMIVVPVRLDLRARRAVTTQGIAAASPATPT